MSFKQIDHNDQQRPDGKTCILTYGYDPIALSAIKKFAASIGISEIIDIKHNQLFNTLRQLIDGTGNVSSKDITHKSPAIVFNAVTNGELNQFVREFRSLNLPRPLFAMVTPTSINWKFADLVDDLLEERAAIAKMQQQ